MSLRRNITTGEIRDIPDEQIAAWLQTGNPKGTHYTTQWEPYTPPPPEPPGPPAQVTKRQWRLYCRFDLGHADPDASVRAAIDQYVPAEQRERAHIEYESATVIERHNPLVPLLAAALGISDVAAAFREMEEKYG